MRFPTKIPTLIGLLLVVAVVATFIFVSEQIFRTPSVASPSQQPKNVAITNVSDTSFTVSWTSDSATTGTILVSSSGRKNTVGYDERDLERVTQKSLTGGNLGKYSTHSVTFRNAEPDTEHTVTVLSDGKKDNTPYTVRTGGAVPPASNGLDPAYGTILTPQGMPAEGALVYLTIEGGQTLSALAKTSGTWLIPLSAVRTEDLTTYLPMRERMMETLTVRQDGQVASAQTDTLNDSPVPDIILGKTYDFRNLQAKTVGSKPVALRPPNQSQPSSAVLGQQTATKPTGKVNLNSPANGASLSTNLPLIEGTGVPNKFVSILIGITNPISGSTKIGGDGLWRFTPPKPLGTGKQSVTATTVDDKGKAVAITHSFEILKSGTQVLGDATPSATLAPTPTIATASPTLEPSPTATLEGQPVPESGTVTPTIILLLLSIALFASGAVVLIK